MSTITGTFDTSQWIAFFTKAGLPPNVAANYALIFSDNRIQLDMLMDLSKEYLFDMGIRVMGDVIAILRFAKEFHTQLAKERVIGKMPMVPNKSAVAGRMVGHYTRQSPNRFPVNKTEMSDNRKSTVISLKRRPEEEPNAKRIRRVPPEEEGAYKIKMPLGTTERTRKILQQMQGSKRSVFTRLGDSAVSSSTDSKKASSSVFERLGPSTKSIRDDVPTSTVVNEMDGLKKKGPPLAYQGVLKMTVGQKRTISTSTPKIVKTSRTVLKPSQSRLQNITKTVNLTRINSILETNKEENSSQIGVTKTGSKSEGIFGRNINLVQKANVKSRLGMKTNIQSLGQTKMSLKPKTRMAIKTSSVFERLGR
ncbi:hypothetical protein X975_02271, partial [Stegodyphus mimosarum]